jgi:hypothetical protein
LRKSLIDSLKAYFWKNAINERADRLKIATDKAKLP